MFHKQTSAQINLFMFCVTLLAIPAFAAPARAQVSFRLGTDGITSLTYANQELLSNGAFQAHVVKFKQPDGSLTNGSLSYTSSVSGNQLTRNYPWGTITVAYSTSGANFRMQITTRNNTSNPLQSLCYEPLYIKFPSMPKEWINQPLIGTNVGSPTVIPFSYGPGVVALVNEEVNKQLLVAWPWSMDAPTNTIFPVRINIDREAYYSPSVPTINRPIAPWSTDTYDISLRFGPPGSTAESLGSDIFDKYYASFPYNLSWNDRRPIGAIMLGAVATGWGNNPRGWFWDPTVNVFTTDGSADFQKRMLALADNSIRILKEMNAQGVISWDIEGEQYPQGITYVGDPRVVNAVAPEFDAIADQYFAKFRNAGFRIGFCIRPQQFVQAGDKLSAQQLNTSDPAQMLIDKIAYAKSRWGATMFYIDSNGDPLYPMNEQDLIRVHNAHPDVLLLPEHETIPYYTVSAPYDEIRQGALSTPAQIKSYYPQAFSVLYAPGADLNSNFAALVNAVKSGDVLVFSAWYDDPLNAIVKSIYTAAGK